MNPENELSPLQRGYYTREEISHVLPSKERVEKGRVAVIECIEEIPCNPCAVVCPVKAIFKETLCTPSIVQTDKCSGCTKCVGVCPGLAIFLQLIKDGKGYVTMPYELSPEPKLGDKATLFNRAGEDVGTGIIVQPTYQSKDDAYPRWIVTVEMNDLDLCYDVRAIKIRRGKDDS